MIITDEVSSYTTDGKQYKLGDTVMVDSASFCPDFMVKVEEGKPAKKVAKSKSVMDKKTEAAEAFVAKLTNADEDATVLMVTGDDPIEVKEGPPKPTPRRRKK